MEEKWLEVESIRMRWEEQGEGRPAILVHGIPTSPALWRNVAPAIRGHAIAWEMVGYGRSMPEGESKNISVARQADYLAAWMQAAGVEKAVLVGHDLGGGVAQILAVRHPEKVSGLVLTNSICYDSWPIPQVELLRKMGSAVERFPRFMLKAVFTSLMYQGHDHPENAREGLNVHWPSYATNGGAAAFVRQIRSLHTRDTLEIAEKLPDLDIPARIVWGAADRFQKIGYGYRLSYDLKARLDRLEHGKHFTPEDNPRDIANAVNAVLDADGDRKGADL